MNLKSPKYRTAFNFLFFSIFAALATLRSLKLIDLDSISLSLIVIGMVPMLLPYINRKLLPYMNKNFKAIEVFGVKAELLAKLEIQDEKIEKQEVKLEEQQKLINELVKFSMSASIFHHLCGISLLKKYIYRDTEFFRREMYFLRDNGFIKPIGKAFVDFYETINNSNLVEIAEPTPIGKACIRLRLSEIPRVMLEDKENLRIDPMDL